MEFSSDISKLHNCIMCFLLSWIPLDDIDYAVITSTIFIFINARAMQAAKAPPKAKSEGHTKDYKRTRLQLPPQSSGFLWHPVTLLLGPQNHAVSALQGTAVVGISSKKLNDKCQYVKSISSCDLSLNDMWKLSPLNLCLKSEYILMLWGHFLFWYGIWKGHIQ